MSLRELKKEAHALPLLKEHAEQLSSSCMDPLKQLLRELPHQQHQELGKRYQQLKTVVEQLACFQSIHDKLQHQSRQLIELKLTEFTQDRTKAKVISRHLLKDDFFNIPQTLMDIKRFGQHLQQVQQQYQELQKELQQQLALEHHVQLLHLPSRKHFAVFAEIQLRQQHLAKNIGKEFVQLAKKSKK